MELADEGLGRRQGPARRQDEPPRGGVACAQANQAVLVGLEGFTTCASPLGLAEALENLRVRPFPWEELFAGIRADAGRPSVSERSCSTQRQAAANRRAEPSLWSVIIIRRQALRHCATRSVGGTAAAVV